MDYRNMAFDPKAEEKSAGSGGDLIPEGHQLFTIYNMYFGKFDSSPKNKRRGDDFIWYLNIKFVHHDTGLLLNRLDNGNEGYWASVLKLERVGSPQLNTLPAFNKFMESIKSPKHIPDDRTPNAITYWVIDEKGKAVFPGYDQTPPGPLGLPVMLNIIHKEVPKMTVKRNAKGEIVKNQYGRSEFVVDIDPKTGEALRHLKEFIETTEVPEDMQEIFGANDLRWPKVYKLPDKYKEIRGEYFTSEVETRASDLPGSSATEDDELGW